MQFVLEIEILILLRCRAPTTFPGESGCVFTVCSTRTFFYVSRLLLLMSGDVEANPGPLTDSEQITSILAAVQRIEAAQTNLLALAYCG